MGTIVTPTGIEVFFSADEIIVSKTDLKGRLTYVNRLFCKIASYGETELLGRPHSIIRHPDMPRSIFKLLWDTLADGREIFAYVKNMTKAGDHYWVLAHVTPSYDENSNMVGYHSNRRVPDRTILNNTIMPLYSALSREESQHRNGQQALAAGFKALTTFVEAKGITYDELIFSL
jgi:PAS domain S-box-containing protein